MKKENFKLHLYLKDATTIELMTVKAESSIRWEDFKIFLTIAEIA